MTISKTNKSPQRFSEERLDVLLDTALEEFIRLGFRVCTIDHISRCSRVSKVTIYRHFPSKEALFGAVAERITDEIAAKIGRVKLDPNAPAISLKTLAKKLHHLFSDDRHTEMMRMLISETPHMPDRSRELRARMLAEMQGRLTDFFTVLVERGEMHHPDPSHAAAVFGVLAGGGFRGLLYARGSKATELALLDMDVTMFLRGCAITC